MPTIKYADLNSLSRFKTKIEAEIPTKVSELTNDSNFVSNTDYATTDTSGVIKLDNSFKVNNQGKVYAEILTYNNYQLAGDGRFVSKGTLENVITGKGLLDSSKVKTTTSTTSGDVYDVTYINSAIGDIETLLSTI